VYYLWSGGAWGATWRAMIVYDDDGERIPIDYMEEYNNDGYTWYYDYTFTTTVPSGSPAIGKQLGIELAVEQGDASWFGYDYIRMEGELGGSVKCINPPNRAENVPVTTILEWGAPIAYTPLYYDLYFGDDANELSPNYFGNEPVFEKEDRTTWDPGGPEGDLEFSTTYYWRVDAYDVNDVGGGTICYPGRVWSFTTMAEEVTILTQPQSVTIPVGNNAEFTVEAVSPTTIGYSWYEVGDETEISNTDTLTIENVQLDDEGYYYCELTNDVGPVVSDTVQLMTKRLVGWWKLDGNLADSVQEVVPDAPAHDGIGDPNYIMDGIVDGGVELFTDDGEIIVIPGTADYYNFYPVGYTISAWVKNPNAGWGGIVGKQNEARTPDHGWVLNHNGNTAHSTLRQTLSHDYGADVGLMDGQWHMVTGMFDAEVGQVRLYADGELAAQSGEGIRGILGSVTDMVIGAESTDVASPLGGLVDDVKLWSYPLSAYEVAIEYTNIRTDETLCPDGSPPYDLNGDCRVDIDDMVEFSLTWLACKRYPPEFCD
jgi:hypothetical protein